MAKNYTQAPLPFMGQKRRWNDQFKTALRKEHLYHTVRLSDFSADGYLDGLTVTRKDYRELFAEYVHTPHVCFLIDPPYLSTQALTYEGYWRLSDYLDVLHTLNGTNYFYFTSDKSSIVELCAWLDREHRLANPFCGATRIEQPTNLNYNSHYTDIMLYQHINAEANAQTSPIRGTSEQQKRTPI